MWGTVRREDLLKNSTRMRLADLRPPAFRLRHTARRSLVARRLRTNWALPGTKETGSGSLKAVNE